MDSLHCAHTPSQITLIQQKRLLEAKLKSYSYEPIFNFQLLIKKKAPLLKKSTIKKGTKLHIALLSFFPSFLFYKEA